MSLHCIVWCCMVLYCWLWRAGCISQDTYLLYFRHPETAILEICGLWDTHYISYNWKQQSYRSQFLFYFVPVILTVKPARLEDSQKFRKKLRKNREETEKVSGRNPRNTLSVRSFETFFNPIRVCNGSTTLDLGTGVGHTAWAPEGREGRYQAGPKGQKPAQRAAPSKSGPRGPPDF